MAEIEQQREISDDMNVLAGGREISGYGDNCNPRDCVGIIQFLKLLFCGDQREKVPLEHSLYTESWSDGALEYCRKFRLRRGKKRHSDLGLQSTLLSTPPEGCSSQYPLEGYPPDPLLQIFNGLQHNIKKLLNVFLIKAGKRYPEIGSSEGNKAYAVCVKKMHPE